jgi:hypothetical protein
MPRYCSGLAWVAVLLQICYRLIVPPLLIRVSVGWATYRTTGLPLSPGGQVLSQHHTMTCCLIFRLLVFSPTPHHQLRLHHRIFIDTSLTIV